MTFRPDLKAICALLALALALAALPLRAVPAEDALQAAREAIARGDGIMAEVQARRALDDGAHKEEVAALIGAAEMLQDNFAEAREWLGPQQFSPDSAAEGFHTLGRLELKEGNFAAAAQAFDQVLAQEPERPGLWVDIGALRYLTGEHLLAVEAAEHAVAIGPNEPAALVFRGMLLRDAGGPTASLPWFENAYSLAPDDPEVLGQYAATLGEAGRNSEMLVLLRRLVELDPRHPQAYYLQAVLAARAGETEIARRLLYQTGAAYRDAPSGLLLEGVLEFRSGNTGAAVDRFAALARRQPDNALAPLLLGRALLASGEVNELVARFAPLAAKPEASPYILTLVGRAYEKLGKREQAATYLDRAANWQPVNESILPPGAGVGASIRIRPEQVSDAGQAVSAARILLAAGRGTEALDLVRRMRAAHPGSADLAQLAGDVSLFTGQAAQAFDHYSMTARIRRTRPLIYRIAASLEGQGKGAAAMQLLMEFQDKRPMDRELAAAIGLFAAERGDWSRANAMLELAARTGSGRRDPWLLTALARTEQALGNQEQALGRIRQASALQPGNRRLAVLLEQAERVAQGKHNAAALAQR